MQPHPAVTNWEAEQWCTELVQSAQPYRVATELAHSGRLADGVHRCMAIVRRIIVRRPALPLDHTLTPPKRA